MTAAQTIIMTGLLIALLIVLVWMTSRARRDTGQAPVDNPGDREQIIEMLAKMKDQSMISAYKKAYDITGHDIAENA